MLLFLEFSPEKPTRYKASALTENDIQDAKDLKVELGCHACFFYGLFGAKAGLEKTNQTGLDLLKKAVEK